MNRTLSSLALAALLLPPLSAAAFTDVPPEMSCAIPAQWLRERGIVTGYADGSFRPSARVNRAEFLQALLRAVPQSGSGGDLRCFTDFRGAEQWYWRAACDAKARGIVRGYPDGSFGGANPVNEAEAMTMAVHAFGLPVPEDAPQSPWYARTYAAADLINARDRTGFLDPGHALNRGEMAILLHGFFMAMEENSCIASDDCAEGRLCSTETMGDCRSACPPGAEACIQVCAGLCLPSEPGSPGDDGRLSCGTYSRDGVRRQECAVCGDGECSVYERCTASNCHDGACTKDCGALYCPSDCG